MPVDLDDFDTTTDKTRSHELHPWGPISSALFRLHSDLIPDVVGTSGLRVDWRLTDSEADSDKTRIRAFRQRIEAAYASLSPEAQLAAASIIAGELARRSPAIRERLSADLARIGWELDEDRLVARRPDLREIFFPPGSEFDAYTTIKGILKQATGELIVIDGYLDETLFQMLSDSIGSPLRVRLLTSGNAAPDLAAQAGAFMRQYSGVTIELRTTAEFHDRFIILDSRQCFHIGASIKHAGQKGFMVSKLEDLQNSNALIGVTQDAWQRADPLGIGAG